jgi:hypothetical protein
MPVTPFHFGVGLLGKGVAPRAVSLCAFVASQVVIGCESAYFLFVAREEPVHRALHTFALATPLGALVARTRSTRRWASDPCTSRVSSWVSWASRS